MKDIDAKIREVTQAFVAELAKLHTRSDWPRYHESEMKLEVAYSKEQGGRFKLEYRRGYGETVKATNLEKLMDEVWRRNDFDDRESAAMEQLALPAPEDKEIEL